VPRHDVQLLWSDDWYDGPLSGMAEPRGERYRFELIDRGVLGAEEEHREYWLIQLSVDQLDEEEQWRELFCRNVGTHFDFTGRPPLPKEKVNMNAFYERYQRRTPPDYHDNLVVEWFQI
jgi:hypothetical protein